MAVSTRDKTTAERPNSHLGRSRGPPPAYGIHNHVEVVEPHHLAERLRQAELSQLQAWIDQVCARKHGALCPTNAPSKRVVSHAC